MSVSQERAAGAVLDVVPAVMTAIRWEMRRNRSGDISVAQLRTLAFLESHPGASLSDAADYIGLTLPAMSRLINGLVVRKLIAREIPPENRRRVNLELTPLGRRALETSREGTRDYLARQLKGLSDEERATIVRAMECLQPLFCAEGLNRPAPNGNGNR